MPTVVVKRRFDTDVCRVLIDGVPLKFDGDEASRRLPSGDHALSWHVVGNPGQKYEVWVTGPPGIGCHPTKTLTGAVSFGTCPFTL